jgi:ABC-type antimicrobial peptide transport system permease subunit
LFGLSAYTAELRRKEMSIRKVLGSSIGQIFILFAQRFFKLIFVSMLIAFPLAYALLNEWLSSFAYRTSIKPMVFITGAFVALAIAFLTICYQGIRTANVNPADTLKNN